MKRFWRALINIPKRFFGWIGGILKKILLRTPLDALVVDSVEGDIPIMDTLAKASSGREFLEALQRHLDDLRNHVIRAAIGLVIATGIAFAFTSTIIDIIAQPIGGIGELQAIEVTEPIGVVMRVAILTGLSIALPYIWFEIWHFTAPSVISKFRRFLLLLGIPLIAFFFIVGVVFAYKFMLPAALPVLLNFMGIPTLPRPSSYVRFVSGMMFWTGIAFELPIISFVLAIPGWITAKMLGNYWRVAFIVMAIIAAMITPTVDPINMTIVLFPLWALYLFSIATAWLGGMFTRDRAKPTT